MNLEVTILGSNSATPCHGRHPSAQVLHMGSRSFLLDCGEGTQMRMMEFGISQRKIEAVFISHMHGDHYLGLAGLLNTWILTGRKRALKIYGPADLKQILDLQVEFSKSGFEVEFIATDATTETLLMAEDMLSVQSFPLFHRIPTTGFVFRQKTMRRKVLGEKALEAGVRPEQMALLAAGEDVQVDGKLLLNSDLTTQPPTPQSYAYCSDTGFDTRVASSIKPVDLLYHEATFADEHILQARKFAHSTAREAGWIARMAEAKKLLIGHFSSRYHKPEALLKEAQEVFANTEVAEEGMRFSL